MNRIQLIGNLARDIEVRFTKTGKTCANFSLAVSRGFDRETNKERGADFINVVLWGETAERASETLKKGSRAYLEGRLQVRDYETSDGEKRYVTEVVGSIIVPCGYLKKQGEDTFFDKGKEVKPEDIPF